MLVAGLTLIVLPKAQAQFTYKYCSNSTTLNNEVSTDFAIVGFSGGKYNEDDF